MSDARYFWPSLSQRDCRAVDQAVRSFLVRSLRVVYGQLPKQIAYDGHRLDFVLQKVERGPIRPVVFGLYTDLVESKLSNDLVMLDALSQALLDLDPTCQGTRITSLTDEELGTGHAERYARLIDDDPERRYSIRPLKSGFQDAYSRVSSALLLLDQGVPELALEIRSLVREIVLVTDAKDDQERSFDGASTFYLWGAVLLNVGDAMRLDLVQQIAHEAAHLLLFGLMMGQPLTENALEERHASPLRQDPRPMEGVVHAAYVLARMSYTLERLLESGLLSLAEQEKARLDLASHRKLFFDAVPVIMRHAQFRPGGASIFRGAIQYMSRESGDPSLNFSPAMRGVPG